MHADMLHQIEVEKQAQHEEKQAEQAKRVRRAVQESNDSYWDLDLLGSDWDNHSS
jgi:hypothetical protein